MWKKNWVELEGDIEAKKKEEEKQEEQNTGNKMDHWWSMVNIVCLIRWDETLGVWTIRRMVRSGRRRRKTMSSRRSFSRNSQSERNRRCTRR